MELYQLARWATAFLTRDGRQPVGLRLTTLRLHYWKAVVGGAVPLSGCSLMSYFDPNRASRFP